MTKKQNKIAIYFLLITFISSCQKRSTKHSVETSKDSKPEEVVEISIESESDNEENNSANEIDPIGYSCGLKNFLPKIKFEKQSKKLKIIFESESKIEFSKPDFDLSSDDLNSIKFLAFAECEGENCCTNQKKICCLSPANEDPAIKDSLQFCREWCKHHEDTCPISNEKIHVEILFDEKKKLERTKQKMCKEELIKIFSQNPLKSTISEFCELLGVESENFSELLASKITKHLSTPIDQSQVLGEQNEKINEAEFETFSKPFNEALSNSEYPGLKADQPQLKKFYLEAKKVKNLDQASEKIDEILKNPCKMPDFASNMHTSSLMQKNLYQKNEGIPSKEEKKLPQPRWLSENFFSKSEFEVAVSLFEEDVEYFEYMYQKTETNQENLKQKMNIFLEKISNKIDKLKKWYKHSLKVANNIDPLDIIELKNLEEKLVKSENLTFGERIHTEFLVNSLKDKIEGPIVQKELLSQLEKLQLKALKLFST